MSKHKNILLVGTMILLVLAGGTWYVLSIPLVSKISQTPSIATSTLPAVGPFTEKALYYTIAVNYPTSTPLAAAANQVALQTMRSYLAGQVAEFKSQGNFNNLTQKDIQMMGYNQGRQESLQVNYLIASSAHTISYIYTDYLNTLGAHENLFFKTFTFDKTTGKLLSLSDLFQSGSTYLEKLSTLARAQLTSSLGPGADPQMITNGTKPLTSSFQNFFLDNSDFVLLFSPYQVAAYTAGPQTVRLPSSDLLDVLKPHYP